MNQAATLAPLIKIVPEKLSDSNKPTLMGPHLIFNVISTSAGIEIDEELINDVSKLEHEISHIEIGIFKGLIYTS